MTMNEAMQRVRSDNFAWLKLIALVLMFFDHASIMYLRAMHMPDDGSLLRLPGRFCIPVFGYLIAYGYLNFSRHRMRYMLRVAAIAVFAEPCYWLCLHEHGNAFIPLAMALLAFVLADKQIAAVKPLVYIGGLIAAVLATFYARTYDIVLVYAMCCFFRLAIEFGEGWGVPAFACALVCNWPFEGTFRALLVTFAVIWAATRYRFHLPRIRIHKAVAYAFYPGHLLFLSLFAN